MVATAGRHDAVTWHPGAVPAHSDRLSQGLAVVPWEAAWASALYGPDGFYRRSAPAEHFATSAQGVPGGGQLLAEAVLALARRHGCSRVVDVGCGRGELLAALRSLDAALHLTGVDVVPSPSGLEIDRWLVSPGGAALPDALSDLDGTLVLAHEWLDVVPCPVIGRDGDGVWRSVGVEADGQEHLGAALSGEELAWAQRRLGPDVHRAEVGLTRDRAAADLLSRVRSGVVVIVDYGHTAADRPAHGTLTAFREGREVRPVPDGSCDLTAHVATDSLADAVRATGRSSPTLITQREIFRALLPDADPATPVPHALARSEPTAYLRALARRGALATLTARGGLGDLWWLVAPVDPAA